ncbi:hypothetical protein E2C01_057030 [Portunus trituberculatus]|uniref:Uncharacterized protein n=1 Tax=Portunus trituberculatus TaxID=210409 RepID=A0A5B7GZA2_PORTR|nr:hypothetical protein [Portunus trituberculatus]
MVSLNVPGLSSSSFLSSLAAILFLQMDRTQYPSIISYSPMAPPNHIGGHLHPSHFHLQDMETDIVTAELFAIQQALSHLHSFHHRQGSNLHGLPLIPPSSAFQPSINIDDPRLPHAVTLPPRHPVMTIPEIIEHFLLHSHRTSLRFRLSALGITTLDFLTLLLASGIHPSGQLTVLRLTCAFFRKTSQLPHL